MNTLLKGRNALALTLMAAAVWTLPAAASQPPAAPDDPVTSDPPPSPAVQQQDAEKLQRQLQQQMRKLSEQSADLDLKLKLNLEPAMAALQQLKQIDTTQFQRLADLSADAAVSGKHGQHDLHEDGDGGSNAVDEHRPLNPDGRVYVNNVAGNVVVSSWDRNEVSVTGQLGDAVDHLEITGDPTSLNIVVKLPKHTHNSGDADLRLMVPPNAQLSLETVSADVGVAGTRGPVKVTTVSGDIGLTVSSQQVTVQTVSGDVILHAPSTMTVANSVSGDLRMTGPQGMLTAETVSGNVELAGGKFTDMHLKSISGDLHLDVDFAKPAMVSGETLSGDITMHVPSDLSGTATMKNFSGEISCDAQQMTGTSSPKRHEYVFGDGKGVVMQLSSFSGDIRVERK
jgi:DUF4097 and DUF4098 domain-containing protein YvlB